MKITNFTKNDVLSRIEEIAKKVGEKAGQLRQDPQTVAEQLRQKGAELFSILSPLFRGRARSVRPEFLRSQIRKQVKKNLVGRFHDDELVDAVTDSLISVAKEDPYYQQLLRLDESLA